MTPRSHLKTVQSDQPMSEVLHAMTQARVSQLPVVARDDKIIGMGDLTAVLEHLQMERDLGVQRGAVNDVSDQPSQHPPLSKAG